MILPAFRDRTPIRSENLIGVQEQSLCMWQGTGQLESVLLSAQNIHESAALEALGAASDSAIRLAETALLVTLVTLVMVLLFRHRGLFGRGGFMWRKPLLLPSFAFIFVIVMSLSVARLPISDYRGYNSVYADNYPNDVGAITVYGGPAYITTLNLVIDGWFVEGSSLNATASLWQNLTYVTGTTVSSGYVAETREVYEKAPLLVPEGVYQLNFSVIYIESGSPSDTAPSARIYLSQVLAEGHMQEILNWETYRLGLLAVGLVLLVAGICYDTGTSSLRKSADASA